MTMTQSADEVVGIVASNIEKSQGPIPSVIRRRAASPFLPKTTYTVKAVVPHLTPTGLPLFSYAVGGYSRSGLHMVALVSAESPAAAVDTVKAHFPLHDSDVLSVSEGVVGVEESWTWYGYMPTEEVPRSFISRLFGWFR